MEIKLSQDQKTLLVVKSLDEEIASLGDCKLKEKLQKFKDEFDKYQEAKKKLDDQLSPIEQKLGQQLNDFNKKS